MKKLLLTGASMLLCIAAYASSPLLVINGEVADKVPTRVTFDGDNVVVHIDGTTETYDMESVSITFKTTGITDISAMQIHSLVGDVLRVEGVDAGTVLEIYGLDGAMRLSHAAVDGKAVISVADLPSGVYLLRAGKKCVKFVKR